VHVQTVSLSHTVLPDLHGGLVDACVRLNRLRQPTRARTATHVYGCGALLLTMPSLARFHSRCLAERGTRIRGISMDASAVVPERKPLAVYSVPWGKYSTNLLALAGHPPVKPGDHFPLPTQVGSPQ
jgi:hypothetical protein